MSDGEFMTEEEMEDFQRALGIATAVCVGLGGGPPCAAAFGAMASGVEFMDWLWEEVIPDSWKATGVFDYGLIADRVLPAMQEVHARSRKIVDETWHRLRAERGLPPVASHASAYLDDWVMRNGWHRGGIVHTTKGRWIKLTPESGPWAYERSPWPKRCGDKCQRLYRERMITLYTDCRLQPLQAAVKHTLEYIALTLSGAEYKSYVGPVREAVWVHGNAVKAEHPDSLVRSERKGWGVTFTAKAGTTHWFHVSIPAPVVVEDVRPVLSKTFVLYDAEDAEITDLHLYDGKNRILSRDGLALSGLHGGTLDASNSWLVYPHPTIYSGLGISVGVRFSGHQSSITFASAGADFNRSR